MSSKHKIFCFWGRGKGFSSYYIKTLNPLYIQHEDIATIPSL